MVALIYSPAKNAMQSGKANTGFWFLRYEPSQAKMVEPLMGYTANFDTKNQIVLKFRRKEEAIAYAYKAGIPYQISKPKQARRRVVSYSDNFRCDRVQPWTH